MTSPSSTPEKLELLIRGNRGGRPSVQPRLDVGYSLHVLPRIHEDVPTSTFDVVEWYGGAPKGRTLTLDDAHL
jgi:hypothetical protein